MLCDFENQGTKKEPSPRGVTIISRVPPVVNTYFSKELIPKVSSTVEITLGINDRFIFEIIETVFYIVFGLKGHLASRLTFHTVLVLGSESSSLALTSICFSIACNLSSGRFIDGCLWNLKPKSRRSCADCFLPITSLQMLSNETP